MTQSSTAVERGNDCLPSCYAFLVLGIAAEGEKASEENRKDDLEYEYEKPGKSFGNTSCKRLLLPDRFLFYVVNSSAWTPSRLRPWPYM